MLEALDGLVDFLVPRICPVCRRRMLRPERGMCLDCHTALPVIDTPSDIHDVVFRRLGHRQLNGIARSWFYYDPDGPYAALIRSAKYARMPELGRMLGRQYACWLMSEPDTAAALATVDAVVPVPMHWWKYLRRGYNQAEYIADGIAREIGCEVAHYLDMPRPRQVQARKNAAERIANARGKFSLAVHPDSIRGRHILLVDDLITTGATASEALLTLHAAAPATLSLLTLALTMRR